MAAFENTEITLLVPQSGDIRTLMEDLSYYSDIAEEWITIKSGLKTDLGSIPSVLRGIFPNDGKAMFGYILHDGLYKVGKYSRDKTDDILEEAMECLGVSWWRRKSVRGGLKLGGWVAWNNHREKENK